LVGDGGLSADARVGESEVVVQVDPSLECSQRPTIVSPSSSIVPVKRCEKSGAAAERSSFQTLSTKVISYTRESK
jgi:hypothetical protein